MELTVGATYVSALHVVHLYLVSREAQTQHFLDIFLFTLMVAARGRRKKPTQFSFLHIDKNVIRCRCQLLEIFCCYCMGKARELTSLEAAGTGEPRSGPLTSR